MFYSMYTFAWCVVWWWCVCYCVSRMVYADCDNNVWCTYLLSCFTMLCVVYLMCCVIVYDECRIGFVIVLKMISVLCVLSCDSVTGLNQSTRSISMVLQLLLWTVLYVDALMFYSCCVVIILLVFVYVCYC